MTGGDATERQMIAVAAVMLRQGRPIDALSRGLTIASFTGLVGLGVLAPRPAVPSMALLAAAGVVGLLETWFAARTAIDAALFRRLALPEDGPDWVLFDKAMTTLRLLPDSKAGRPAVARIAGAFRLLTLQIIGLVVQASLLVAAAIAAAIR